jgi:VIT1/CCC1 family predicted Fe2+/Mn2+ transporter
MLTIRHIEKHFTATEAIRDVVIGMSDSLTVPFALAAGLSAAVTSTGVIVTAGLAEVAAGAIAMGLGGYLAARTVANPKQCGNGMKSRTCASTKNGKSPTFCVDTAWTASRSAWS